MRPRPGPPVCSKIPRASSSTTQRAGDRLFYYDDDPHSRPVNKPLSKDEAQRMAVNFAKLPICGSGPGTGNAILSSHQPSRPGAGHVRTAYGLLPRSTGAQQPCPQAARAAD